jgi:hypothetical protein
LVFRIDTEKNFNEKIFYLKLYINKTMNREKTKIPEDWFMPLNEFSQSPWVKEYMEPEARQKTLKLMLEEMIKEKRKGKK